MEPTHLIIIRHAETQANVDGRMQGWSDDPLTERGKRQIQQTARRLAAEALRPSALYTSSLPRARLTAEAIGSVLRLTPVALSDLREMDLGQLDGASVAELEAAYRSFTGPDDAYPGGESLRQFVARIVGAFEHIMRAHPGEHVVVVTHGGVIATVLAVWSGDAHRWREFVVDNCSYTEVTFSPQPELVSIGDCAHLVE